jgi:hypothetical protein
LSENFFVFAYGVGVIREVSPTMAMIVMTVLIFMRRVIPMVVILR